MTTVDMEYFSSNISSMETTGLKQAIHNLISLYPELTVYVVIETLEVVKADLIEALTQAGD